MAEDKDDSNKAKEGAGTDLLATSLFETVAPAVKTCDENIRNVLAAQDSLALQIQRLHAALEAFSIAFVSDPSARRSSTTEPSEDEVKVAPKLPIPDILEKYAAKLSRSRARLKKINASVTRVDQRLENIRGLVRKKALPAPTPGADKSVPPSVAELANLLDWEADKKGEEKGAEKVEGKGEEKVEKGEEKAEDKGEADEVAEAGSKADS